LNFYFPAGFEQLLIGLARPATERKPPPPDQIAEMMAPPWLAEKLSEDYGETSILGNPFVDMPDPQKMLTRPTPGATIFPFTANAQDLESYSGMGGRWTVLANGTQTGGSYCLAEVRFAKGVAFGPRIYSKEKDEMFYVFEGELTFLLGDKIATAEKGSFVYIPNGTVYAMRVDSNEAHCLNIHTRSGFEELLELACEKSGKGASGPLGQLKGKQVDAGTRARLLGKIGLTELAVPNPLDSK
jgi:mannose-6-phosphate isomerase-like protein (cupin superfamily)